MIVSTNNAGKIIKQIDRRTEKVNLFNQLPDILFNLSHFLSQNNPI